MTRTNLQLGLEIAKQSVTGQCSDIAKLAEGRAGAPLTLVANSAALPPCPPRRSVRQAESTCKSGFAELPVREQAANPEFATSVTVLLLRSG